MAIDELIDVDYDENATKVTRLANFLRIGLAATDSSVMLMASKALGRLARSSGTLTAECVEFEVKRALEWLQERERYEPRRHAAVMVLKELAHNSPTLFYVHVSTFVDLVWVALRDPKQAVREGAGEALRACLELISERESRMRLQWYQKIFDETNRGFRSANPEVIHGSLIALGELLRNTGDFMMSRFKEVCDIVLKYRDNRDRLVKRAVILLLPRLGTYSPDAFVHNYLNTCINHLLAALKNQDNKGVVFIALGEIAVAVSGNSKPYLENIVAQIKAAAPIRGRNFYPETLSCISMLAISVGPTLIPYMSSLLPQMFSTGLCMPLIDSLRDIAITIPTLAQQIQQKLLDLISQILANKPFGKRLSGSMIITQTPLAATPQEHDTQLVALALRTLGSFDFSKHNLLEFVRECVVGYLDDPNPEIRRETSITCTKLMSSVGESAPPRGHSSSVIGEVLSKLLVLAISDSSADIRKVVLTSLDTRFDHQLAQAENLRSLFIALNDEVFEIRELAITVIGRLTTRNPAYVMPSLRKTLIQLLTELEFSGDSRSKEESARLLCNLIRSSERLIKPYVEPILKALLMKLRDNNPRVASYVLAALGELAILNMGSHLEELLPLIIETLQDQSSVTKREVALRTLGQLTKSTGYVITPFTRYPNLLDILLNIIKSERTPSIRQEVIKVMGILGAVDPHSHKITQLLARSKEEQKATDGEKGGLDPTASVAPSSEDYYPTVAIAALMRILRDPTLSAHHTMVVQAVMFIFKSLGLKCVPFLPQIIPPLLQVMNTREPLFREFLFQQLGSLVSIVKQHIRDYLDDIFGLIEKHWNSALLIPIINLVEEQALNDEFKVYLPNLIPQILGVLHTDRSAKRQAAQKVLHALEIFGNNLDDYLHLVIPAIVRLFERAETPAPVRRLSRKLNFADYASRIIHPLSRVLESVEFVDLRDEVMQTICNLVIQMGSDYNIFIPMLAKVLTKVGLVHPTYDTLITRLVKNQPLVPENSEDPLSNQPNKSDSAVEEASAPDGVKKLKVNEQSLKKAWEASQRSTKEDWAEWIRKFSVELLRESPSPALRSCLTLAQEYPPLVRELFNAGFVSCWNELHEQFQDELVHSLETALLSPTIPHEILQILLNLAEFMEHNDKPLPIDISTLGALAEKCHAYAKALHYKETEFQSNPSSASCIEALISINNQLQQPEAAIGILQYAQRTHSIELKESWYEKLRRWEDALAAYERKQKDDPTQPEYMLGRMRALHAMGEWERLFDLSKDIWKTNHESTRLAAAPLAAAAAWNMGEWSAMEEYAGAMSLESVAGTFMRAILEIHRDNFVAAQRYVDASRDLLDAELTPLIGESYNRAYKVAVRIQQLSELEEIIEYKRSRENPERQAMIRSAWKLRLKGMQQNVEVWQNILAVHSLVIPPREELDMWLKFIGLCRKGGRLALSRKTLTMLMGSDPAPSANAASLSSSSLIFSSYCPPRVTFAYLKQLWSAGAKQPAFEKLRAFVQAMKSSDDITLLGRAYLKEGEWQMSMRDTLDEVTIPQIMNSFRSATECDAKWYKAWHAWAFINFQVVAHYSHRSTPPELLLPHLVPAIYGFFRSIALGPGQSLQDTLRLLTLWFKYGALKDVEAALLEGFNTVKIDTWLQVIPQIIARIHTPVQPVRRLIHELLTSVGKEHPQALVYPLTVASKSQSTSRLAASRSIMDKMRKHSANLVDQALMVSQELIRVAIPWNEMWHEGLEDASRLYFGPEHNVEAMFATLQPLHELLDKGPETLREVAFQQAFGRDLQEALDWCKKYTRSGKETDLNQAWDLYYHVFRRISRQLKEMMTVDLQFVSPKLLAARDLELAVPGTYRAREPIVRIASFVPTLSVFDTKQRPRRLSIHGSNGVEYAFLIKGHEDLRQDERVMQLFGLVNGLLAQNHEIAKSHLSIERYEVIPLSPNSGLIGWVPHSDILHTLIRDYRESRKILLNIEHRLMLQMSADYDNLPLLQKVEIFEYALDSTNGYDLAKVLWLKSRNSEVWLDRRTNYTRSLAVMSMVGYILGLGDRHPRNLMIDKLTGRIIHIDFGDCFEVAMHREKYPEKIPFRLTRMLINAMEVSGIEGNFRITCEAVMGVLRDNHDSLMAVLEAFVYDPLINWRLFTPDTSAADAKTKGKVDEESSSPEEIRSSLSQRTARVRTEEQESDTSEVMNSQALTVINRIAKKLTGRDFSKDETLDVPAQVQRLIDQATSNENLCQCYIGWCPFW